MVFADNKPKHCEKLITEKVNLIKPKFSWGMLNPFHKEGKGYLLQLARRSSSIKKKT